MEKDYNNIFFVDDSDLSQYSLKNYLKKGKIKNLDSIISVKNSDISRKLLQSESNAKVLICDYDTIKDNFLEWLNNSGINIPVFVITYENNEQNKLNFLKNIYPNVINIFKKPYNPNKLIEEIQKFLKKK